MRDGRRQGGGVSVCAARAPCGQPQIRCSTRSGFGLSVLNRLAPALMKQAIKTSVPGNDASRGRPCRPATAIYRSSLIDANLLGCAMGPPGGGLLGRA